MTSYKILGKIRRVLHPLSVFYSLDFLKFVSTGWFTEITID